MFLGEALFKVKQNPDYSLTDFIQIFKNWVEWYNTEKPHRSMPGNNPPIKRYFDAEDRFFRPLQANVNWNRWLHEIEQRKVNKYNEIHYKSQKFHIPSGYSGTRVEVIEYEDKIELYYRDQLIITHSYNVPINQKKKIRKITHNGTIKYKGKLYTIDYKLSGKTVEVQEINDGKNILVYMKGVLLKTLDL